MTDDNKKLRVEIKMQNQLHKEGKEEDTKEIKNLRKEVKKLQKENEKLKTNLKDVRIPYAKLRNERDKIEQAMEENRQKFNATKVKMATKEGVKKFLEDELGFTPTQVSNMMSKKVQETWKSDIPKRCGDYWSQEEMVEASYQMHLSRELYDYLRNNFYIQRPMPSHQSIARWKLKQHNIEEIKCSYKTSDGRGGCNRTFYLRDHYDKHCSNLHQLQQKCDMCDKSFNQLGQLRNHVMKEIILIFNFEQETKS